MLADDLLVSVRSRKLPCVLDPALVLGSAWGLELALRLTWVTEPWLTRAFWQLIDASELLLPQLDEAQVPATLQPRKDVLRAWIALRDQTDAGSWPFRWVGDRFAESQLKDHADAGLIDRYESLAESLAGRAGEGEAEFRHGWPLLWDPLQASLDTLALSAALDAAVVLTASVSDEDPWPVRALHRLDLHTALLDPLPADSLFAAERALLRDALAAAGLASMAQRLPRLAVVHMMAGDVDGAAAQADVGDELAAGRERCATDPLRDARAWWYLI
ncbi:MAG: hypothetical protein NDI66_08550 [Pseudomonas sp.]|nr:hypothetical protein [Pseudomonas sp.]